MNLVNVKFSGSRAYRDRTALANVWEPGDIKAIPADDARVLRRFAEFAIVDEPVSKQEQEQATVKRKAAKQEQEQEDNATEGMLLTIESWDKNQLEAYARQYEVELDKRRSLQNLRLDVANLVEQYGVR